MRQTTLKSERIIDFLKGLREWNRLKLVHVELEQANAFIVKHHRHHDKILMHRFSIGATLNLRLVGVAVVGRPLGGQCQDRWVEVTRLATDGTPNACSFLYGAAWRAAQALGYERVQTYILDSESGISLKVCNPCNRLGDDIARLQTRIDFLRSRGFT